jgi:hypothetical protein
MIWSGVTRENGVFYAFMTETMQVARHVPMPTFVEGVYRKKLKKNQKIYD